MFNPNEKRVQSGPHAGEWTSGDSTTAIQQAASNKKGYKIVKEKNPYHGGEQYNLYFDNMFMSTISDKNMKAFLSRKIPLDDHAKIEAYLKYNNL